MNVSDSERIAGFLESQPHPNPLLVKERGFVETKDIKKADLVIFNTCGVRQTAEDRVYGQIHNLKAKSYKLKAIILTGCLANRKDVQRKLKDKVDLFCEIKNFPNAFSQLLFTNYYLLPTNHSKPNYLEIIPSYSNTKSAFVPIMTGCNNFCSYCVVPYARGREVSRPVKDIIKEIDNLSKKGCKEITLLGQNVNSYKYESSFPRRRESSIKTKIAQKTKRVDWIPAFAGMTNITFPILLDYLASHYKNKKFKFLTSHPKDFSERLIDVIAKNKNISREIHLPFQAGSDKILKLMNRPYTRKKYLTLISKIKKKIPGAQFTTDVIVGFPGETEADFQKTIEVFQKVKYNEAYINKYSPRPGTAAMKLGDPISWDEKKRREKALRECLKH